MTRARQARPGHGRRLRSLRGRSGGCRRSTRREHVARGQVPFRTAARGSSASSLRVLGEFGQRRRFEAQIHLDGNGTGERLDDLLWPQPPQRPASQRSNDARRERAWPAGRGRNLLRTPGRTTLTASTSSPSAVAMRAWWTCAIEAAATGSLKAENRLSIGRPSAASTMRDRASAREGRHAVLQLFKIARRDDADDVGARREELPELDIGRPKPRQRRGEARGAVAGAAASRRCARRAARGARVGGSALGSTSASAPSRARTNPARRLRERWTRQPITVRSSSRNEWRRRRRSSAPVRDAPKSRIRQSSARRPRGSREAADRFDEVAIGLGVAGRPAWPRRGITLNE